MVKKQKSAKVHKHVRTKHVKLRAHHAKSYRKRHYGLLIACILGALFLLGMLMEYRAQVTSGATGSRNFVADLFDVNPKTDTTFRSTYGFSVTADQKKFYSMATDATNGETITPGEAVGTLPIRSVFLASSQPDIAGGSGLQLRYYPELTASVVAEQLQNQAFERAGILKADVALISTKNVSLGGKPFEQSIWKSTTSVGKDSDLFASFSIYTGIINSRPMTILVSEGFADTPGEHPLYDDVLKSLSFDESVSAAFKTPVAPVSDNLAQSTFDTILMSSAAAAADKAPVTSDTEKIAALYGPAVVKVFNTYCADIKIDGRLALTSVCSAGSGSGFFVGADGHIATNGHVASMNALDLTIVQGFYHAIYNGKTSIINTLMSMAPVMQSDFASAKTKTEQYGLIANKLYEKLDESKFTFTNNVQNLFVAVGTKQPDTAQLITDTKNRQKYKLDSSFKAAEVTATDYRQFDGNAGFKASDVSIIKVEGNNYPVVQLGSYDDITQGSGISILGFPGNANQNGIVDSKTSTATLTTGKVSSKKNASGSDKRLIETDTTIGHGNSGGPAFTDSGKVVGIATYTSDGSGKGDGVFNYVRDIKDMSDLASAKSINLATNSQTQTEWEKGMEYFYEARYSKALVNFAKVKELYPHHNKVAEFMATAERRIANGEDVQDFPVIPVAIGAAVLGTGAVVAVVFIIRHRKKHHIYQAGVAQGAITQMSPGAPAQAVAVSPPQVQTIPPAAPAPATAQPPYTPPQAPVDAAQPPALGTTAPVPATPPVVPPATSEQKNSQDTFTIQH